MGFGKKQVLVVFILLVVTLFCMYFISAAMARQCNYPGETCGTRCCTTALTEHGYFYQYCDGVCKPADGLEGRKDALEWCKDYIFDDNQIRGTYCYYNPSFDDYCDPTNVDCSDCVQGENCTNSADLGCKCFADCSAAHVQGVDFCIDQFGDNGINPDGMLYAQCMKDAYTDYYNCRYTNCEAWLPWEYYLGHEDYLGWDIPKILDWADDTGKHPCDLLFPEFIEESPDGENFLFTYSPASEMTSVTDPYKLLERNLYNTHYMPGVAYASFSADSEFEPSKISTSGTGLNLFTDSPSGDRFINRYDRHQRIIRTETVCGPEREPVCSNEDLYETVDYDYDTFASGGDCCIDEGCSVSLNRLCEITQQTQGQDVLNIKFYYDVAGRAVKEVRTVYDSEIGDRIYDQEYRYDDVGNLLVYNGVDGNEVQYEYNNLGQLIKAKMYDNLLKDSGFELNDSSWDPTGWTLEPGYSDSHSGRNYARVKAWNPRQEVDFGNFKQGRIYNTGFWAKKGPNGGFIDF